MRKNWGLILALILGTLVIFPASVLAAPTVLMDGRQLSFDVPPVIDNGRTLVPMAAIFSELGATVKWDGATQTVNAQKSDTLIVLTIGNNAASKNGQTIMLDVPPKIIAGRTMVPLAFVGNALGAQVNWDGNTETVTIISRQVIVDKDKPGFGKITFPDGGIYEGEISNGLRHGQGTQVGKSGNKYVGNWIFDHRTGQGFMTWPNGNKYEGNWQEDLPNGQGIYTYSDGGKYTGDFKNGSRSGYGTMTWANGDTYQGAWEYDGLNGEGTFLWNSGYANGDKYVGEYKQGLRSGYGVYTYDNGDIYDGQWLNDKPNVQGTFYFASGDKYVGGILDGLKNGLGTYYFNDGGTYTGIFVYGLRNGSGTYYRNGKSYPEYYENDVLINTTYSDSKIPVAPSGVIESRINGIFEGWDGDTVFSLMNGQIWQQSSFGVVLRLTMSPKVTIYPSYGRYQMHVEGVDQNIYVIRLR